MKIYTIGVYGSTEEEFFGKLTKFQIDLFCFAVVAVHRYARDDLFSGRLIGNDDLCGVAFLITFFIGVGLSSGKHFDMVAQSLQTIPAPYGSFF